ncbi:MAG: TatD family hydrolase [Candidatus Rhabdochlamydia sp.]
MWIDTHAHLTLGSFDDQLEEIIKRALDCRIEHIVNICTDQKSLNKGLELSKQYPWIVNTAAATPHDVVEIGDAFFEEVSFHAKEGNLRAIGETGLDYYSSTASKEIQAVHLKQYLMLAKECSLPLIFHCREAFDDLFKIVDEKREKVKAILHCFTGTHDEAKECLKRGWLLSISGIVTFKNAKALQHVIKETPLESLVIETDAPYLAPQSKRGQVNEPSYVIETAQMIADLKNIPIEEVARVTTHNAHQFFSFQKEGRSI